MVTYCQSPKRSSKFCFLKDISKYCSPLKQVTERWALNDDSRDLTDFYSRLPRENFAKKFPFELDDFQKRAVLRLENKESVFICAHTSAGKTVIADYAIALC